MEDEVRAAAFAAEVDQLTRQVYKRTGYLPTYFLRLVGEHGAVDAARHLLDAPIPQEGFSRLYQEGMPEASVEALALMDWWAPLFTPAQRAEARRRLEDLDIDVGAMLASAAPPGWWP